MIAVARSLAMFIGSSLFGAWLGSTEKQPTDKTGLAGWWAASPWFVKVLAGLGLVALAVAIYNWARHGNWKGKGGVR